jgi:hypothetical protein
MRLRTAVTAVVACFALAVPSAALAVSPTQDAYSGIAGQQQGGSGAPTSGTVGQESSGDLGQSASGEAATTQSSGSLPFTGLEVGVIAMVGIALLGGGVLLFRASRRAEPQG